MLFRFALIVCATGLCWYPADASFALYIRLRLELWWWASEVRSERSRHCGCLRCAIGILMPRRLRKPKWCSHNDVLGVRLIRSYAVRSREVRIRSHRLKLRA